MSDGGWIGKVFGTGESAPVNAAIFVIILCAALALLIVFVPMKAGLDSPAAMMANLRELAAMALAFLFGRSTK